VLIEFANWSGGSELPDPAKMYEQLMSPARRADRVIGEKDAPVPVGAKVLEATYHRPYQGMPRSRPPARWPSSRTASSTVWTHSQGVFPLRATIARALGLQARDIRCIHAKAPAATSQRRRRRCFDAAMLSRASMGAGAAAMDA